MADPEIDSYCGGGDNPGKIGLQIVKVDDEVGAFNTLNQKTVRSFAEKVETFLHKNPHIRTRALELGHDIIARVTDRREEIIIASGIAGAVTAGVIVGIIMHEHKKKDENSNNPH